ncbi:MAG: MptD family putative ECF transporter S component [Pseudobutyrivibrio sp.]|nr:MptD family putative ECF transporter S component [Pseudobutyrivibrio sp.]
MKMLKIKDVVMVALLSALYAVVYMLAGSLSMIFGPFGHAISPGICGLVAGSVVYFMCRKVGKFGQFILMQAILLVLFSIMGAGYLPWFITSMIGAVLADVVASREAKPAVWKIAVAAGLAHVGQALGSIIPATFFMESYKEEWMARGQSAEAMDEMVRCSTGILGVLAIIVVFIFAFAGIYIGHAILKKHFEKKEIEEAA